MKIMTLLGTRPEIIRLCRVIARLDQECDHILVHTGQNYDPNLSDVFFTQMKVRSPDHFLNATGARAGRQIGQILAGAEDVLLTEKPDRLLVLGDTNSCLASIMAKRLGIPVYHMEAGNRCFDDRVPEEVNRRIIDHSSDVHLPYTQRSRENLLAEGLPSRHIYVTGNPIYEVLQHYRRQIDESTILTDLDLKERQFFLVTLHRAENVDDSTRLRDLIGALKALHQEYGLPVIVSTHPRTKDRMEAGGLGTEMAGLKFLPPFGFFDFVHLETSARCVLSDSGTVQEECCILRVPNVTLREVTERPETLDCGSNILAGADPEAIREAVKIALRSDCQWSIPSEYLVENVSETVLRLLLGFRIAA